MDAHVSPIAWLHPDGSGVARDGTRRLVRVRGALPGDRVRLEAPEGRDVVATDWVLVEPSPDRRPPSCPRDASCGGCDLSGWAPAARLDGLARMVAHGLGLGTPPAIVASPSDTAFRARIGLGVEGHLIGYRAARSHELVDVGQCEIARPEVQRALTRLRTWRRSHADVNLRHVELRSDGARVVYAFAAAGRLSDAQRDALAELGDVDLDGRVIAGDPTLRLPVAGLRLFASPSVFYQVHLELNEALVAHVLGKVREVGAERVLDLYAGIGNFGLAVAREGVPVVAVELEGPALRDLRRTATEHGITGIETLAMDAARFDPSRTPFDVAVIDPPRAGAGPVLPRVLRNRPRRVILVSCDLRAARRDLGLARDAGYRLTEVRGFDLFPRTRHLELVSVLDR